jgi:hypothetical protein
MRRKKAGPVSAETWLGCLASRLVTQHPADAFRAWRNGLGMAFSGACQKNHFLLLSIPTSATPAFGKAYF